MLIIIFHLFLYCNGIISNIPNNKSQFEPNSYDNKVLSIPMKKEDGIAMFQKWTDQALSSLFAAVANKKYIQLININIILD